MESPLEKATRRTIKALTESTGRRLTERDAVTCQLLLDLAAAVDAGKRAGRASAVAMSAAQMLACLDRLDPSVDAPAEPDAWGQLVADMQAAAAEGMPAAGD